MRDNAGPIVIEIAREATEASTAARTLIVH
jgi:hypothetical protein